MDDELRRDLDFKPVQCIKCPNDRPCLDVSEFYEHFLQEHLNCTLFKCACGQVFATMFYACAHSCKSKQVELIVSLDREGLDSRLVAAHIALNRGMRTSLEAAMINMRQTLEKETKAKIEKDVDEDAEIKEPKEMLSNQCNERTLSVSVTEPCSFSEIEPKNIQSSEKQLLRDCYRKHPSSAIESEPSLKRICLGEDKKTKKKDNGLQVKNLRDLHKSTDSRNGVSGTPPVANNTIAKPMCTQKQDVRTYYGIKKNEDTTMETVMSPIAFKSGSSKNKRPSTSSLWSMSNTGSTVVTNPAKKSCDLFINDEDIQLIDDTNDDVLFVPSTSIDETVTIVTHRFPVTLSSLQRHPTFGNLGKRVTFPERK